MVEFAYLLVSVNRRCLKFKKRNEYLLNLTKGLLCMGPYVACTACPSENSRLKSLLWAGQGAGMAGHSLADVRAGLVVINFIVLFVLFRRHGEHVGCALVL